MRPDAFEGPSAVCSITFRRLSARLSHSSLPVLTREVASQSTRADILAQFSSDEMVDACAQLTVHTSAPAPSLNLREPGAPESILLRPVAEELEAERHLEERQGGTRDEHLPRRPRPPLRRAAGPSRRFHHLGHDAGEGQHHAEAVAHPVRNAPASAARSGTAATLNWPTRQCCRRVTKIEWAADVVIEVQLSCRRVTRIEGAADVCDCGTTVRISAPWGVPRTPAT